MDSILDPITIYLCSFGSELFSRQDSLLFREASIINSSPNPKDFQVNGLSAEIHTINHFREKHLSHRKTNWKDTWPSPVVAWSAFFWWSFQMNSILSIYPSMYSHPPPTVLLDLFLTLTIWIQINLNSLEVSWFWRPKDEYGQVSEYFPFFYFSSGNLCSEFLNVSSTIWKSSKQKAERICV